MTPRRPTKLARWHEWAIYLSSALLLATGIAWLVLDRWVRIAGDFGPVHHPAEQAMLILHGIIAYVLLIFVGALIPVHIKGGWLLRRNRVSGVSLGTALGVLAVTALGLYYLSNETARGWTSTVHWVLGVAALPLMLLHALRGRGQAIPRPATSPRRPNRPKRAG